MLCLLLIWPAAAAGAGWSEWGQGWQHPLSLTASHWLVTIGRGARPPGPQPAPAGSATDWALLTSSRMRPGHFHLLIMMRWQCAVAVFACISMNQSLLGSLAPPPLCPVRLVLSGRHRFMTLSNTGPHIFYIILEWKMCSEYWYLCMNTLHDWAWQFFLAEPSLHFSDRIMTR